MFNELVTIKEGYKCFIKWNDKYYTTVSLSNLHLDLTKEKEVKFNEYTKYVKKLRVTKSGYHYALNPKGALRFREKKTKFLSEGQSIVLCKIEIREESKYDSDSRYLFTRYEKIPNEHISELCCHSFRIVEELKVLPQTSE